MYFHNDHYSNTNRNQLRTTVTVLTQHYTPFNYKPSLLFAKICCGGIFISNYAPPRPYMENLIRTEELCDSDEQEEG